MTTHEHALNEALSARILIVDDEATPRRVITRALNLVGYRAEGADSGEQALRLLSDGHHDLMLLDLRMPGMDGVEVMSRAKQSHPNLLVIILTAYATVDSAIAAVRAGATDYLLKPCSIRDIESAIDRALRQRQDRLRRQQLIRTMADALEALQREDRVETESLEEQPREILRAGRLVLDLARHLATVAIENGSLGGELTAIETAVLSQLMRHPAKVFSHRELARASLGYELTQRDAEDVIRPHISRLRRKIEPDPSNPTFICTVRGEGYYFATQ